jgi:hypothetical protein
MRRKKAQSKLKARTKRKIAAAKGARKAAPPAKKK